MVTDSSRRFSIASMTARFSRADRSLAREWRFAQTPTAGNLNEDPLTMCALERDIVLPSFKCRTSHSTRIGQTPTYSKETILRYVEKSPYPRRFYIAFAVHLEQ